MIHKLKQFKMYLCLFLVMISQSYGKTYPCQGGVHSSTAISSARSGAGVALSTSRWGDGVNTEVTFSFITAGYVFNHSNESPPNTNIDILPLVDTNGDPVDDVRFPATTRQVVLKAFEAWSAVADITFREVIEPVEIGQIRVGGHGTFTGSVLGHGFFPPSGEVADNDISGDLHLDTNRTWDEQLLFATTVHEIGHSLGLNHILNVTREMGIPPQTEVVPLNVADGVIMFPNIGDQAGPLTASDKAYIQYIYKAPAPRIDNIIMSPSDRLISWLYPRDPFINVTGALNPLSINFTDINNPATSCYSAEIVIDANNNNNVTINTLVTTSNLSHFEIESVPYVFSKSETDDGEEANKKFDDTFNDGAKTFWSRQLDRGQSDNAYVLPISEAPTTTALLPLIPVYGATHSTFWRFQRSYILSKDQSIEYRVLNSHGNVIAEIAQSEQGADIGVGNLGPLDIPYGEVRLDLSSIEGQVFSVAYLFKRGEAFQTEAVYIDDIVFENVLVQNGSFTKLPPLIDGSTASYFVTEIPSMHYRLQMISNFTGGISVTSTSIIKNFVPAIKHIKESGTFTNQTLNSNNVNTVINIEISYTDPVIVTVNNNEPPELDLANVNRNAIYKSGSGTDKLVFQYTISQNDDTGGDALNYTSTSALDPKSSTINNSLDIDSIDLTLPETSSTNALAQSNVRIDTIPPIVTIHTKATNDVRPELTGTVDDINATLLVSVSEQQNLMAIINGNGTWTLPETAYISDLAGGLFNVQVTATDAVGNIGMDSTLVCIDTIPPIVTIHTRTTNDVKPELTGTVDDINATLLVSVSEQQNLMAINNGNGTWTLPETAYISDLAGGLFNVQITATDAVGNIGMDSTLSELTIDTTPLVILNTIIAADNSYIEIQFNKGVYGDNVMMSGVDSDDFITTIDDSGVSIDSSDFRKIDGRILEGGESVIRIELSLSGMTDSSDVISIEPKMNSVFDNNGTVLAGGPSEVIMLTINEVVSPPIFSITFTFDLDSTSIPLTFGLGSMSKTVFPTPSIFYFDDGINQSERQINSISETPSRWTLKFDPDAGQTGNLSWTIINQNPGYKVYLQKVSGKGSSDLAIDLTNTNTNPISVSDDVSFELVYGPRFIDTFPALTMGWNLISLPYVMTQTLHSIFPNIIQSPIWFWNGKNFQTLGNGSALISNCGYWVYFEKNTTVTQIEGVAVESQLNIEGGWNLTGYPRNILLLSQVPNVANIPSIWRYSSANIQYQKVISTLNSFQGLWVYRK